KSLSPRPYIESVEAPTVAADPVVKYMSVEELTRAIDRTRTEMARAAANMEFIEAARLRDEMLGLQRILDEKSAKA
ncbi:MAG: UvrB/UvrC motif-containing protein, partial [Muribaculaceae bacterium]|nr:UvrB/UvrC motif-containing protein [Muribaculaceae bacterium]MCF0214480.1 UvrB/UvrC motif-containing protein [Muribaculaceae bacterium]